MKTDELSDWLTTAQAADLTGYHVHYIRILLRQGTLEARKFGPVWMVSRASVERFIAERKAQGEKRGPKSNT